jgi:hydrophobic/amphiphilic exporter-1 (mainly G- bacteria), HAE1 family
LTFFTGLALRRRSVTVLIVLLVLAAGFFTYRSLQQELFPDIEFPNINIVTVFPNANPEAVERDITEPIEEAVDGIEGLKEIQSTSSENLSIVLLTFEFGENMEEAERTIESSITGIDFPDDVEKPFVSRINSDTFPVLQLSVTGDRDIPSLQRILDEVLVPQIERVEGVFDVTVQGEVDEQVTITVDTDKLEDLGLSMLQVSNAIRANNISFPAGDISNNGSDFSVRATHEFGSLEDIRNLPIGFESNGIPGGASPVSGPANLRGERPILLRDVAQVEIGTAEAATISRTNGRPSLNVVVLKEPDANTVAVTEQILASLGQIQGLPPDIEILTLQNDGPEVEQQLSSLLQEGLLGFLFAVSVVFIFLINTRPTLLRGLALTLRPTLIIGISIPLSIMSGILIMGLANLSLNFMSLAGLAIAIGRVVDDSIVVLENMYRHMQRGEDKFQAALDGTREVGAAIISSTLTTIVVFAPLAFIQGLVGEFFTPFALSVSFAMIASAIVALTVIPVLGVLLLREGDFPEEETDRETILQKIYTPALIWTLRHKIATVLGAVGVTLASLLLLAVIPITFFPEGAPQFLTIDVELPMGTSAGRTFAEVMKVEEVLEESHQEGHVEVYQATLGSASQEFGPGAGGAGFHVAGFFVKLAEDVPPDIADRIRAQIQASDDTTITVTEISSGPPADPLEVTITGGNFTAITAVARELERELAEIDGVINVSSGVSDARDEVTIRVDPTAAAEFGLSAADVGGQVNQFIVGTAVSEVDLNNLTMDMVVRGQPEDVDDIEKLEDLNIAGPLGVVKLGSISQIAVEQGPVSISRFDLERSVTISGEITAEDTQAVGVQVQAKIDALELPPGIEVRTGGIFQQISEGFQDVFTAILIGIVLVYLAMVVSLGSLRDPFIVILSLPLAIVGALVALAITDRSLSLSALMGFLLLVGIVVTNAIVLITFVEQLRQTGMGVYDALIEAGRTRVRPILMTAFTTIIALFPLSVSSGNEGGIIGAELATVVIGGLISSTFLTLIVVPVIYTILHVNLPNVFDITSSAVARVLFARPTARGETGGDD